MKLSPEDRRTIVAIRIESARRAVEDARLLHTAGSIRGASNRAYYAMFYAASALAIANGQSFSKHSGLIGYIHKEFVNSGILGKSFGRSLQKAFENRSEGDYQDIVRFTSDDVAGMMQDAADFVEAIETLIARDAAGSRGNR